MFRRGRLCFGGDNFQFRDSVKFPDNAVSVRRAAEAHIARAVLAGKFRDFLFAVCNPHARGSQVFGNDLRGGRLAVQNVGKLLAYAPGGRSCSGFLLLCFDKA